MTGLSRRALLVGAACTALAACAEQIAIVDDDLKNRLTITDVMIDTSALQLNDAGYIRTGRETTLTPAQLAADLDAKITWALRAQRLNGATRAILTVAPRKVWLVSPGQAFALGGQSTIKGRVSLVAETGEVLLPPTEIAGISAQVRSGGLLGAVTTPRADEDYRQTVAGFADKAVSQLFQSGIVGLNGKLRN